MKAAAVNDASTHHLSEAGAIQINRKLWGNMAAASMPEAGFKEVEAKKKTSLTKRSATEIADRCIETVRAFIEHTITELRRAHAPRAKFELLFEALGEIIVDVQRQTIDAGVAGWQAAIQALRSGSGHSSSGSERTLGLSGTVMRDAVIEVDSRFS